MTCHVKTDRHREGHSGDRAEVVVTQLQTRGCQLVAKQQKLPKGEGWGPPRRIRTARQRISLGYVACFAVTEALRDDSEWLQGGGVTIAPAMTVAGVGAKAIHRVFIFCQGNVYAH